MLVGPLTVAPDSGLATLLRWLHVVGNALLALSAVSLGLYLLRTAAKPGAAPASAERAGEIVAPRARAALELRS